MKRFRSKRVSVLFLLLFFGQIEFGLGVSAAPIVDNNAGTWTDSYQDGLGIFTMTNLTLDVFAGSISLESGQTTGSLTTVKIIPPSFDAWGTICLDGNWASPAQFSIDVINAETETIVLSGLGIDAAGCVDVSGLDPNVVTEIRVVVNFDQAGNPIPPSLTELQVTWNPVSVLLLDKTGPNTIDAGETFVYFIRYSVNFVEAKGLVLWDPLPLAIDGTVIYPTEYGQSDDPTFVSATGGGLLWSGPGDLDVKGDGSILVPEHSVYWDLGDVAQGVTEVLAISLKSPNGSLDGTVYSNQFFAAASNAQSEASALVSTTVQSIPSPQLDKRGSGGLIEFPDIYYALPESDITFIVADPLGGTDANDYTATGRETMYNTVVYDDVSFLLSPTILIDTNSGDSGFQSISGDGFFDPAYMAPDGSGPFPAVVWTNINNGIFAPGATMQESFTVTLTTNATSLSLTNTVYMDSDQTSPILAELPFIVEANEDVTGIFAKGDDLNGNPSAAAAKDDDPKLAVGYGDTYSYRLRIDNNSFVHAEDVVMVDRIADEVSFVSASFSPASSSSTVFYATTTAYLDSTNPPPITTIPPTASSLGPDWSTTPPAVSSNVTWVAYYFPRVSSEIFPPADPVAEAFGDFIVQVDDPLDPCVGMVITNKGLFHVFTVNSPLSGMSTLNTNSFPFVVDVERTVVKSDIGEFDISNSQASLTPAAVDLSESGEVEFKVVVENLSEDTTDQFTNVVVELVWSQLPVNGVSNYLSFISVSGGSITAFDPGNGTIELSLGAMAPGDQIEVKLNLLVPLGVPLGEEFTVSAQMTGFDDVCIPVQGGISLKGTVVSSPDLKVFKNDVVDLIPGGGEIDYEIEFINVGEAPSHNTFIVDRVPSKTVFVQATGPQGEQVFVTDVVDLPPSELSVMEPIDSSVIAALFSPAILNDGGTTNDPSDDVWTSPFGEATTWVAWQVDDQNLDPVQFPTLDLRQVGIRVRNDEDPGPGQVDSPEGTLIFNEEAIFSDENLQAIGNQVITTIEDDPSIEVSKDGPDVILAGAVFEYDIQYVNNSANNDSQVVLTDNLPLGLSFVSATHTWNATATGNGATPVPSGIIPSSVITNMDGSFSVVFNAAPDYRGGDLLSLEGGQITLQVQADPGFVSGELLNNEFCGVAVNSNGVSQACDEKRSLVQNADLWLRKLVDTEDPSSGDVVTYTLIVANMGGYEAEDVVITDVLPSGVTYQPGSTLMLTPGYTIGEASSVGQTLTWSIATGNAIENTSLAVPGTIPGLSGDIYFNYQVMVDTNTPSGSSLTNVATTTTSTPEDEVYPNTTNEVVRTPFPDPTVTKNGPDLALPGQSVSWSLSYRNLNNEDAQGVYLVDTLPDTDGDDDSDVTFSSAIASGPGPVSIWFNDAPISVPPVFDPLNPAATGWSNSSASVSVVNHIAFDVGLLPRNSSIYDIDINVQMINPITGQESAPGLILTNNVEIFSSTVDDDPTNNTDSDIVRIPGLDVAIEKVGDPEGSFPGTAPGKPIVYTITYDNPGTVNAYGIRIVDILSGNVDQGSPLDNFSTADLGLDKMVDTGGADVTFSVPVTREIAGNQVTWYLGTTNNPADLDYYRNVGIPPGASGSFDVFVSAKIDLSEGSVIDNDVEVISDRRNDGEPAEEFLDNNSDDTSVIVYRADLVLEKSVVDALTGDEFYTEAGSLLEYTLSYDNIGNVEAENVVLQEIIPEGTTYVPGSLQVPAGAVATFFPDEVNPTAFQVEFLDPVPAPSTFWSQNNVGQILNNEYEGIRSPIEVPFFDNTDVQPGDNSQISDMTVADMNEDGLPDILVTRDDENELLLSNGDGTFTSIPAFNPPSTRYESAIGVGDFNEDGHLDAITGSGGSTSTNYLFLGIGDGTFTFDSNFSDLGNSSRDFAVSDFNSDGHLDVATLPNSGSVSIYLGSGTGTFSPGSSYTFASSISLSFGDLNNDGNLDLVVGNIGDEANAVLIGVGDGTFTETYPFPGTNSVLGAANANDVGDFNNDGNLDVIFGYSEEGSFWPAEIYLGDGAGGFTSSSVIAADYGTTDWVEDFAVADFNLDGNLDIAVIFSENALDRLLLGNGDGTFESYIAFPTPSDNGYDIAAGDFDQDGYPDLVVDDDEDGEAWIFLNTSSEQYCHALGTIGFVKIEAGDADEPRNGLSSSAVDVDGDLDLDIVVVGYPQAYLFINDGSGNYTYAPGGDLTNQVLNTGFSVATFDVDGDLDQDIIIGYQFSNIRMLLNDGTGVFTETDAGALDDVIRRVNHLEVFNADGDGDLDLAIATSSGNNLLFLNDGSGSFTQTVGGDFGTGLVRSDRVRAFDVDGDLDPDLVVDNWTSHGRVYLNDGAGVFTQTAAGDYSTMSLRARYVTDSDFDGDGDIDLVSVLASEYKTYVYVNNGAGLFTRISGGDINTERTIRPTTVGDFDLDGDVDVITDRYSSSRLFLNDGTGNFVEQPADDLLKASATGYGLAIDVDADGREEFFKTPNSNRPGHLFEYVPGSSTGSVTALVSPTDLYPDAGTLVSWGSLVVDVTVPDGASISYDLLDPATTNAIGAEWTGLVPDEAGQIDLSGLDPANQPILIRANLVMGPNGSPELCGWFATFNMSSRPSFTFRVVVSDPVPGSVGTTIENTASISTSTPETDLTNNADEDVINILFTDVQVTKTVDEVATMVGSNLNYQVCWQVNGPQGALNVEVTDVLPYHVDYVPGTAVPPEDQIEGSGLQGDPYILTWSFGDQPLGASGCIDIPVVVQTNFTSLLEMAITDNLDDGAEQDSNGQIYNDIFSLALGATTRSHGLFRFANLDLPQGASIKSAYVEFTSTGTRTNAIVAPWELYGENVDDSAQLALVTSNITSRARTTNAVAWTPTPWTQLQKYQTPDVSGLLQEVVDRPGWMEDNAWSLLVINPSPGIWRRLFPAGNSGGAARSPRLVVTYCHSNTTAVALSTFANITEVENDRQETTYDNNNDDVLVYVGDIPNLYIEKTGPSVMGLAETGTYTLVYGNNGNVDAPDSVITDTLPEGLSFVSSMPAETTLAGTPFVDEVITWDFGTLTPGATGLVEITFVVGTNVSLVSSTLVNQAIIATSTNELTLSDNQDDHPLIVSILDLCTIGGHVWHDVDRNGVLDLGEAFLEGVEVQLTGTDLFGQPVVLTTTTGSDGSYLFTGLLPGTYNVTEVQPSGYLSTTANPGTLNTTAPPTEGTANGLEEVINITLEAGDNGINYDFGEALGSIGDLVWFDDNANGVLDGAEVGAEGVSLDLYIDTDNDGMLTTNDLYQSTVSTGVGGIYTFPDLVATNYLVVVTDTGGVLDGTQLISGVDPAPVSLGAGENYVDADFGYLRPYHVLEKEDMPDPVRAGDDLTYTVWVGNPSMFTVSNVVVTETYDAAFIFGSSDPAPDAGDNVWNLGDLAVGQTKKIVISGTVAPGTPVDTILTNRVVSTASNTETNRTEEPTLVIGDPLPDETLITIEKVDDVDPNVPGGALTYTVRVANEGSVTATNVVVTEAYDYRFTYSSSSIAPISSNNVFALGDINVGDFVEFTISGMISATALDGDILLNLVGATSENTPPVDDEEVTIVSTNLPPVPEITKSDSPDPVLVGELLTYTITVENVASVTVSNVTVTEAYSAWFSFDNAVPTPSEGENTWFFGDVPFGWSTTIVVQGYVDVDTPLDALIFNTAEVTVDGGSKTTFEETEVVAYSAIGDFVWDDLNGDGLQDGGEPGITNMTVLLYEVVGE